MKFKLYFAPGACSFVPHAMLQIAGADFEPVMVKLHKDEQNSAEYKAMNPRGQVPVLVVNPESDSPVVLTQIVAIIGYLNDVFPNAKFLPTEPLAKARVMSTLAWMNNTAHPTFTHIFMPQKFTDNSAIYADLGAFNRKLYASQLSELNAMVEAKNAQKALYLLGFVISPLDLYCLTLTRWGGMAGIDPTANNAALWAHIQMVAAHPSVAEVVTRERLQLNVFRTES
jgi:glutathione S-transferase